MEISRKTDYALRMLAELVRADDGVISVRNAAEKNDVPYSFARSIQHDLVLSGIVESLRGSHGGMKLAVDPDKTTLLDVVEATQGPVTVSDCDTNGTDGGPCPRAATCPFNPIWCGANSLLVDYLRSVSLTEVVFGTKAPSLPRAYWREDAFEQVRKPAMERLNA